MSNRIVKFCAWLTLMLGAAQLSYAQHYVRTDLTANSSGTSATAVHIDPNLVNAWGLTRGSGTPWWVSDNGMGLSTLYDATGTPQSLVVTIPTPDGKGTSAPTGTVFNSTKGFELSRGNPAVFLFVTEDGTISGWNPAVSPRTAVIKVNHAGSAVYKGCAIVNTVAGPRLYATNFQTRTVEVYDGSFNQIPTNGNAFDIGGIGNGNGNSLQRAPFNVQNVGGNLVVTFAFKHPGSNDEEHAAGLGAAAVFDPFGRILLRLQDGNWFNAPWGVALAPSDFGVFAHRLIIGNFGAGTLDAFNTFTGAHEGTLLDSTGAALTIDGLWALSFGGDATRNGLATSLYFTAGPADETLGLFGTITAFGTESRGSTE